MLSKIPVLVKLDFCGGDGSLNNLLFVSLFRIFFLASFWAIVGTTDAGVVVVVDWVWFWSNFFFLELFSFVGVIDLGVIIWALLEPSNLNIFKIIYYDRFLIT